MSRALPRRLARTDPAMPIADVIKQPLGSGPGVSILATTPTTNPMRSVQRMSIKNSIEAAGDSQCRCEPAGGAKEPRKSCSWGS